MRSPPAGLVVLLAAMTAIGPFSIDTYLPAFPAMAEGLGATPIEVQQTLSVYMATFSFMMLWHGALSDAYGRRRVLLAAFAMFAAASLFCALATRIELLWLGRALQGLSAGAGMVVSRAIVRDVLEGPAAQRLLAHVGIMFAIAPAVAPVVGGWIQSWFGWQAVFVFLALYGAVLVAAIHRMLPETLPPEQRQNLEPRLLARAYAAVFAHPAFIALALTLALAFNGFFVYVLSAPKFLIDHLGVAPTGFLWLFGPVMVGMMGGNWLAARLAGKISSARTVGLGFAVMMLSALANLGMNAWAPPMLPWAVLPLACYVFGMSLNMPVLSLRLLDLFPEWRGLVSSCQGATQTAINTLTAALLAPMFWDSTLAMAAAMAGFLVLAMAAFALRNRLTAHR